MTKERMLTIGGYDDHIADAKDCKDCWSGFPVPCINCKKGLVHATFGDENYDGDYWLYFKCSVCGNDYGFDE